MVHLDDLHGLRLEEIKEIAACATLASISTIAPSSIFKFYYTGELLSSFNECIGIDPKRVGLAENISYNAAVIVLQNICKIAPLNLDPVFSILSAPAVRKKVLESQTLSTAKDSIKKLVVQKVIDAKFSMMKAFFMFSLNSYLLKTPLAPLFAEIDLSSSPTVTLNHIKELLDSKHSQLDHQSRLILEEAHQFISSCVEDFQLSAQLLSTQTFSLEDFSTKVESKLDKIKEFKADVSKLLLSHKVSNHSSCDTLTKITGKIALKTVTAPIGILSSHSAHFSGLECLTRITGMAMACAFPNQALLTTLSTEALALTLFNKPLNEEDQAAGIAVRKLLSSIRAGFRADMRNEGISELAIAKNELIIFDIAISSLTFLLTYSQAPAINALTHLQIIKTLESQSSLSKPSNQIDFLKSMMLQSMMAVSLTIFDATTGYNPIIRCGLNTLALTFTNPFIMEKILHNPNVQNLFSSLNLGTEDIIPPDLHTIFNFFKPGYPYKAIQDGCSKVVNTVQIASKLGFTKDNLVEKCSRLINKGLSFYTSYSLGAMIETVAPSIGSFVYAIEPNKSILCKAIKTTSCVAVNFLTGSFLAGSIAATATEQFFKLS